MMKKFLTSAIFIFVFVAYGLFQRLSNANGGGVALNLTPIAMTEPTPTPVIVPPVVPAVAPISRFATVPPTVSVSAPTPTLAPAPRPKGQYADGTYTGDAANAYYGNIQVQVAVSGGKIVDVGFLQYPNDRNTSRYINGQAMPILRSEAIKAQNAQVNIVSGASDTSRAFRESLASALSQAKN